MHRTLRTPQRNPYGDGVNRPKVRNLSSCCPSSPTQRAMEKVRQSGLLFWIEKYEWGRENAGPSCRHGRDNSYLKLIIGILFSNSTWEEFQTSVLEMLKCAMIQSPFGSLLNLNQKGIIKEYHDHFEWCTKPLICIGLPNLKGIILNVFKDVSWTEIKLHTIERLKELMNYV